ncbi:Secreted protein [Phytophthora megakarya]|uniref:Secreted protein n=1 Tax=Phytophthora megakarya TaxID=4795 RepID=A0A225WMM4_9STRA|nr:Secreted protein [Phytophthora megakarya]
MSFVLWLRELDCVKFQATPAVLMAIFSGRLGSRGLTLLHFRESTEVESLEDGSTTKEPDNASEESSPSASCRIFRPVMLVKVANMLHKNARCRSRLTTDIRYPTLKKCMAKYRIDLPASKFPTSHESDDDREYLLNSPMQHALSELARRSDASLQAFVEMVRGQTPDDYRSNKNLVPSVLKKLCKGYKRLNELLTIAQEGVEVRLRKEPPRQQFRPPNHGSSKERLNVLRKNLRKEQDAWRSLVLDSDLLEQWPEVIISPFGVVDKGGEDASVSGRTIHDLSYPEDDSINDYTDPTSIIKPEYHHCDAVASEILRAKREHPEVEVEIMAGNVASAFRNISIHSNSVYLFAGQIEEENIIIIELSAPFG